VRRLRRLHDDRGQTAVEFALITPVIVLLLLGIVQVGIAFHDYITVTDAARAGARKAVVDRFTGETNAQLQQHVRDAAGDLDQSKLKVTVTLPAPLSSGSSLTVTAKYPYSINLLGFVVASGDMSSTMTDRLE
jgi:Flp pilus assembly protein TadG